MTFVLNGVEGKMKLLNSLRLEVPTFVTSVIHDCSEKEFARNHDVVIIEMESSEKSGVADEIAEIVMREIPSSSVLIHRNFKTIEEYRVHTASFVIIVSDYDDSVRE